MTHVLTLDQRFVSTDQALAVLKAAGEETRLRILLLLSESELNVTDLTHILGQSQPRISRHLKLLVESGLVERVREGSYAFYRLAYGGAEVALWRAVLAQITRDESLVRSDMQRLDAVRAQRAETAERFFAAHAEDWNRIRSLHVEESAVEAAILEVLGARRFEHAIDLGTGTGRILELIADRIEAGTGVDLSPQMIAIARSAFETRHLSHCRVRHGDIMAIPQASESADLVVIHQVLHFLPDPLAAIMEARRLLRPGGLMLVVDFAPHELVFLQEEFAHSRLGIAPDEMANWFERAGLRLALHKDLTPSTGVRAGAGTVDRLTVSLWLGELADNAMRSVAA